MVRASRRTFFISSSEGTGEGVVEGILEDIVERFTAPDAADFYYRRYGRYDRRGHCDGRGRRGLRRHGRPGREFR